MKSYVIDIQRCSLHDGPGIRTTVFLKGCPLRCQWCHNPESQSFSQEISYNSSRCINCGECVKVCPQKAHEITDGKHWMDYGKCNLCSNCAKVCTMHALSVIGKDITPKEAFDIVIRDEAFYLQGGGGLTISGGEALSHPHFTLELLKLCKESGVHTCIETSGYAAKTAVEQVMPLTDLFLFDFKLSCNQAAKEYIGHSLEDIHNNFEYIYGHGKKIILRCPIIPGVNDTKAHFKAICEMVKSYPELVSVELLPYHSFGVSKAKSIGKESKEFDTPTEKQKEDWMKFFNGCGFSKIKMA